MLNHGQALERLAERGGLSWDELLATLELHRVVSELAAERNGNGHAAAIVALSWKAQPLRRRRLSAWPATSLRLGFPPWQCRDLEEGFRAGAGRLDLRVMDIR